MDPFQMVVAIVLIVTIGGIYRRRHNDRRGIVEDRHGNQKLISDPDTGRLREEIKTLKDRVAVLERIATDKSNRLEHEIEALRDNS
jgi:hypothetical protein